MPLHSSGWSAKKPMTQMHKNIVDELASLGQNIGFNVKRGYPKRKDAIGKIDVAWIHHFHNINYPLPFALFEVESVSAWMKTAKGSIVNLLSIPAFLRVIVAPIEQMKNVHPRARDWYELFGNFLDKIPKEFPQIVVWKDKELNDLHKMNMDETKRWFCKLLKEKYPY